MLTSTDTYLLRSVGIIFEFVIIARTFIRTIFSIVIFSIRRFFSWIFRKYHLIIFKCSTNIITFSNKKNDDGTKQVRVSTSKPTYYAVLKNGD